MAAGNFRKNVVESMWEATIKTGKSKELYYIRTESEYIAREEATEHAKEIFGDLVSLKMIIDNGEKVEYADDLSEENEKESEDE